MNALRAAGDLDCLGQIAAVAGQYGFIEDATGLPITAAMADLLEKAEEVL